MATGPKISLRDLPMPLRKVATEPGSLASARFLVQQGTHLNLHETEHRLMMRALDECEGNVTEAAKKLGISRRTLHRKLNQLKK